MKPGLGDPESGVEKDPDNEFLFVGVAGVGQAGCFISGKRFAFVLVAHRGVGAAAVNSLGLRQTAAIFQGIVQEINNLGKSRLWKRRD